MKTVVCLYMMPPGELWIRFGDGETRRATVGEEKVLLPVTPEALSENRLQKPPPRALERIDRMAV